MPKLIGAGLTFAFHMAQMGPPVAVRYDLPWALVRDTKACAILEISSLSAHAEGGKKGAHKRCAAQRSRVQV